MKVDEDTQTRTAAQPSLRTSASLPLDDLWRIATKNLTQMKLVNTLIYDAIVSGNTIITQASAMERVIWPTGIQRARIRKEGLGLKLLTLMHDAIAQGFNTVY